MSATIYGATRLIPACAIKGVAFPEDMIRWEIDRVLKKLFAAAENPRYSTFSLTVKASDKEGWFEDGLIIRCDIDGDDGKDEPR